MPMDHGEALQSAQGRDNHGEAPQSAQGRENNSQAAMRTANVMLRKILRDELLTTYLTIQLQAGGSDRRSATEDAASAACATEHTRGRPAGAHAARLGHRAAVGRASAVGRRSATGAELERGRGRRRRVAHVPAGAARRWLPL